MDVLRGLVTAEPPKAAGERAAAGPTASGSAAASAAATATAGAGKA